MHQSLIKLNQTSQVKAQSLFFNQVVRVDKGGSQKYYGGFSFIQYVKFPLCMLFWSKVGDALCY